MSEEKSWAYVYRLRWISIDLGSMLYGVKDSGRSGGVGTQGYDHEADVSPAPTDEVCVPPKTEPQKAAAKPSTTEVYARLRSLIIGGEIPPDTKINIVALARDLGVSQTPVREALQRLEGDNLITYQPGRGYSTTPLLDLPGLRALFEFRLLVEPWAARAAAVDRLTNPGVALGRQLDDFEGLLARRAEGGPGPGPGPEAEGFEDVKDVRQEL